MDKHRDKSNRLTFDFDSIKSGMYSKVTDAVVNHFNLEAENKITKGLDEVFQDFKQGNKVVGLEWDNWSGYIVNAKNTESESLATEIASYISAKCCS